MVKQKKHCSKCDTEKHLTEFYIKKESKDGYRSECKACHKLSKTLYYKNNTEKIKQKVNKYYSNNIEKMKEIRKSYKKNNLEKIKADNKEWIKKNKNHVTAYQKEYKKNHKDEYNKWEKEKKLNDPLFKLKKIFRTSINSMLKNKGFKKTARSTEIIGCSYEQFLTHIENQWASLNNLNENGIVWMNWDNYGNPKDGKFELNKTWDIDHVIPLYTAKSKDDIIKLNHYTNLCPLCSYTNRWIKKNYLF